MLFRPTQAYNLCKSFSHDQAIGLHVLTFKKLPVKCELVADFQPSVGVQNYNLHAAHDYSTTVNFAAINIFSQLI